MLFLYKQVESTMFSRGKIVWNSTEIENPSESFIPPRNGYTSQVPQLYNYTLRNNILLGLSEDQGNLEVR